MLGIAQESASYPYDFHVGYGLPLTTKHRVMQFNFVLDSIDDILERQFANTDDTYRVSSWYRLTSGLYSISLNHECLLAYTGQIERGSTPEMAVNWVDYYVARLHEDILDSLPNFLFDIPKHFMPIFETVESILSWRNFSQSLVDSYVDDGRNDELLELLPTIWWIDSWRVDTSYLDCSQWIWLFRVDDTVYIRWTTKDNDRPGCSIWESVSGCDSVSVCDFLLSVESFHNELCREMETRIQTVDFTYLNKNVPSPGVALAEQHENRTMALVKSMAAKPTDVRWDFISGLITDWRAWKSTQ